MTMYFVYISVSVPAVGFHDRAKAVRHYLMHRGFLGEAYPQLWEGPTLAKKTLIRHG